MTKITVTDGKTSKPKAKKKSSAKHIDFRKAPAKKTHPVSISSSATHSTVQKSTTLSRRYVKRPTAAVITPVEPTPIVATSEATSKATTKTAAPAKPSRKDRAAARLAEKRLRAEREQAARAAKIAKAKAEKAAKLAEKQSALQKRTEARLAKKAARPAKSAVSSDRALKSAAKSAKTISDTPKEAPVKMQKAFKKRGKGRRIFLALVCSSAAVAALVAFVNFSIPDISVRVAAIQTGIEATYPTFIPRNYTLVNVTSEKDGMVTMFFDGPEGASFSLSEEKSTWDSTALLNNYVKKNYPQDFTTLREQGITIYVRGEKASWVNGGLLYKINANGKNLTKEQIKNIATSL